jgi:hydrogenase expression/formation protein HypC
MCLAVPGRIIERRGELASVDFQGTRVEVSLALTPEAQVGSWVLVHAGFAISDLDEAEARQTWAYLREAGVLGPDGAPP